MGHETHVGLGAGRRRGHPVVGDPVYGFRRLPAALKKKLSNHAHPTIVALKAADRQMLHAWQLSLTHPYSGENLTFQSPLPVDIEILINKLRGEG